MKSFLVLILLCLTHFAIAEDTMKSFLEAAPTPPMGWNSWDCFGCTVTEDLTKQNADYMAKHLKQFGWQYVVVDIQWYEPQSKGFEYDPNPKPEMDEFGRLWPVATKHPSSTNGRGFKPLADYVHSLGLKFGVHLLRGIPKEAVKRNTKVMGTNFRAADIANQKSQCKWNPDMFGVDMTKPGAQEYYNSVFNLLASWDVDFVKVDDLSAPDYHEAEVAALRKAIDQTGRTMVLSTSPGETPLAAGPHVSTHANMWRVSNDFWDGWDHFEPQFKRLADWTKFRKKGAWPDGDMLPLGNIRAIENKPGHLGWTNFTKDEQRTLMTVWCIARSPLMMGGHMPNNDPWTLSLLTNDEVLSVNQNSDDNHQLRRDESTIVWTATVPNSKDLYVALINVARDKKEHVAQASLSELGIKSGAKVRDLWSRTNLPAVSDKIEVKLAPHASALYRVSPD